MGTYATRQALPRVSAVTGFWRPLTGVYISLGVQTKQDQRDTGYVYREPSKGST